MTHYKTALEMLDDLALPIVATLFVARGCATARAMKNMYGEPEQYSMLVRVSDVAKALEPIRDALTAYVLTDSQLDGGRFEEWSLAQFAAECRAQARDQLDPEFSRFMAELAKRLSALASSSQAEAARLAAEQSAAAEPVEVIASNIVLMSARGEISPISSKDALTIAQAFAVTPLQSSAVPAGQGKDGA